MTGTSITTKAILSVFTIALLKDTGFYAKVNEDMAENQLWGKGKGCEFLNNICLSNQKFEEFPDNELFGCTFDKMAAGVVTNDSGFDSSCSFMQAYNNR